MGRKQNFEQNLYEIKFNQTSRLESILVAFKIRTGTENGVENNEGKTALLDVVGHIDFNYWGRVVWQFY